MTIRKKYNKRPVEVKKPETKPVEQPQEKPQDKAKKSKK